MNSSRTSVKRRFKDNNTQDTFSFLLSIFPSSVLARILVCVCVLCHDVVRESFYCQESCYHKMPLFFLITVHASSLSSERMVCAFASKQFEYVVYLSIKPNERARDEKKNAWNLVWCLLSPPEWKRYRRQCKLEQVIWVQKIGTRSFVRLFFYCVIHSRIVIAPKWRRQINMNNNKIPWKRTVWAVTVCDLKYTFFPYLSSLTRAIWQYFGFNSID